MKLTSRDPGPVTLMQPGDYALVRDGVTVGFFDSVDAAFDVAERRYPDRRFVIQNHLRPLRSAEPTSHRRPMHRTGESPLDKTIGRLEKLERRKRLDELGAALARNVERMISGRKR